MKTPTLDQWNSLPAGTYAFVTLQGENRQWNVLKHDDEQDVTVASTLLVGPAAWTLLYARGLQSVELAYVPGGVDALLPGPTMTMGELTAALEAFDPEMLLRMRVDGEMKSPGRPFHHGSTEREVSLNVAAQRTTVGEFLEQLAEYKVLDREPFNPLAITPDLPVRVRERNHRSDDAWSITDVLQAGGRAYLYLA
ncbi:hypothetical protein [Arthrobacter sp. zg-Y1110]|uniref:hypothetical protein n=1 Tax=Arthrobacter sp. zg-Y1110 TaxID=2886932 RepID=UPI001D1537D5|nr:hypothetical protein [Arthrobacter sp. zg-Y1110]MCC3292458.1 hypothetical protein [Arthrobacter sp. zg-Y1110]UWX87109.1 hypothetical protein N2K99_17325 [Arthrobacter sp. zg-Y1110]